MSLSIFQFIMSNLFILFRLAAVPQKLQAERRLTCGGSPMGEKNYKYGQHRSGLLIFITKTPSHTGHSACPTESRESSTTQPLTV